MSLAAALAQRTDLRLTLITTRGQHTTLHDLAGLLALPQVAVATIAGGPFAPGAQRALPRLLRTLRPDCFHAPYYVMPYTDLPCPTVVTLYDVIPRRFPQHVAVRARLAFEVCSRLAARAADRIITISASAARDLQHSFGINPARISVTPLAADAGFVPQSALDIQRMRDRLGISGSYIVATANSRPHKNLGGLLDAWQRADLRDQTLVVVGSTSALAGAVPPRALLTGSLPQPVFAALLSGAVCFVLPSRYEGFGLPPLEALACGTPVVCGGHSALPEVVGDAGYSTNVADPAAFAAAIRRVVTDDTLRGTLRARALARAAQFSWHATAARTAEIYASVT